MFFPYIFENLKIQRKPWKIKKIKKNKKNKIGNTTKLNDKEMKQHEKFF